MKSNSESLSFDVLKSKLQKLDREYGSMDDRLQKTARIAKEVEILAWRLEEAIADESRP